MYYNAINRNEIPTYAVEAINQALSSKPQELNTDYDHLTDDIVCNIYMTCCDLAERYSCDVECLESLHYLEYVVGGY